MPRSVCFLFGQEGPGLSDEARERVRRDVLDRAVRLDALDQRLGGRRDRHAQLDHAARRPRGGLARASRRWRRPRVAGSGRTGRRPPSPRGWAAASSRRRSRQLVAACAGDGGVGGRRRVGLPTARKTACDPERVRLGARDVDPGVGLADAQLRRARPARAVGSAPGSGTSLCRCGRARRSAPSARRARARPGRGEERPGEDRGGPVGEGAADERAGRRARRAACPAPSACATRCRRGDRLGR